MADLSWNEVKQWLDANKTSGELKTYLDGVVSEFIKSEAGKSYIKTLLEGDEGKTLVQPLIDRAVTKGIDTYKEKTLPGLVQEEVEKKVKEIHPEETPEQKRIRLLEDKQTQLEKDRDKEKLSKQVLQILTEKKLGSFGPLMDLLVGSNEETTAANINSLEAIVKEIVKEAIQKEFHTRDPYGTPPDTDPNFKNPFSKEHWNLTAQGELWKKNPTLAKKLQSASL